MRFKDYPYERPDMDKLQQSFTTAIQRFKNADSPKDALDAIDEVNELRLDFITMNRLASIRHSIDTRDEFYDAEKTFFDQNNPRFSQWNHAFYRALIDSPHKDALVHEKGHHLFDKAALSLKTFSPEIMGEMQDENRLASQHQKILASAKIEFQGKTYNLSQMAPFAQNPDRHIRKAASHAVEEFFKAHEKELDELYDDLVKVRNGMAKKLGYARFTELAYDRLGRTDYDAEDVANYRKQIHQHVVPLNEKLFRKAQERLGIDAMKHYDLSLDFKSGNPKPVGNVDALIRHADTMYTEMSHETNTFFRFMRERELLDLEAKQGKAGGGYCTFIPNHDSPFIFANFNGTKHDVDVLTHEAGHAFQMFMSRDHDVPEYLMSTMEVSEIHSMSMEFFAWPWIEGFFGQDTDKYRFSHLSQALKLLAYGAAIDEFQHAVYDTPDMSPEKRKRLWRKTDAKYFPFKVYDDADYYERGGSYQAIMHIFAVPFYMIDYTLAQACAFQYWMRDRTDHKEAWQSYLTLCKAGGTKGFTELLDLADLHNPFEPGVLDQVVPLVRDYLDGIDDTTL